MATKRFTLEISYEIEFKETECVLEPETAKDGLNAIKEHIHTIAPNLMPIIQAVDSFGMGVADNARGGPREPLTSHVECWFRSDVEDTEGNLFEAKIFTGEKLSRAEFEDAVEKDEYDKDGNILPKSVYHVERGPNGEITVVDSDGYPKDPWQK